ncbi:hypothetical protein [Streptomyces hydrogenans]|uniref:Sugar kinase n=1 Tax=Streptomyces hydrogenans TaxID=1873719 RepID=A0ABQ3P5G4_9ACTN|nr:hypothetical protein [Streptomyces hydrogenans]GHG39488.1 hypothetical protein GCM10018784_61620 [Streptomyces hydrogenans]GHI20254.1 hypothetical protein Shyd_16250 [Streptomyces hydrogenans]
MTLHHPPSGTPAGPPEELLPEPRSPEGRLPEDRGRMIRRRWLTAVIIVLLVGIPAGYLVISAGQSRESGIDKERESSVVGLQDNWPSLMKRRVFEVPVPAGASGVAYYETSNWKTSRLYVRFTTTATGLDTFLAESGTGRSALTSGRITVSDRDADIVGWTFPDGLTWSGTTVDREDPRPSTDITVDLTDPAFPRVFAVSTTSP